MNSSFCPPMIPREIHKKIRQTEIRTNRVVTGFAAGARHGEKNQLVFWPALTCVLSPGRGFQPVTLSISPAVHPANPVAGISKDAGSDSPSPWGEGRDEGGRETNFPLTGLSFQPPAQLRRIPRPMPDSKNFDFTMFDVDGEVNRVRPRFGHFGFPRQCCRQPKSFRVLSQSLQKRLKFIIKSQTNASFAFFIPVHSLIPFQFGFGLRNDFERHFLARRRFLISAETSSMGVPRPGCFNASSARRSSSAICSGVSSSSKSWTTSRIFSNASCCSANGSLQN